MSDKELSILLREWFANCPTISRIDRNPVWKVLKEELSALERWKTKGRWNPEKGYEEMLNTLHKAQYGDYPYEGEE